MIANAMKAGARGPEVDRLLADLAYASDPALLAQAKLGVLAGSLASGVAGALVLRATAEVRPA